jgi:hypothetical protein
MGSPGRACPQWCYPLHSPLAPARGFSFSGASRNECAFHRANGMLAGRQDSGKYAEVAERPLRGYLDTKRESAGEDRRSFGHSPSLVFAKRVGHFISRVRSDCTKRTQASGRQTPDKETSFSRCFWTVKSASSSIHSGNLSSIGIWRHLETPSSAPAGTRADRSRLELRRHGRQGGSP